MIGDLRHRITIQSRTPTPDEMGGFTEAWSSVATVWSDIKPISANERMFAMKLEDNTTHKIRIRHRAGLDAGMRILFGSRTFQIKGIITDEERRVWMEIRAVEGVVE